MAEVAFSNSLIESWWESHKKHWLYLNTLDTTHAVHKLVEFYVTEHNPRLPHSSFTRRGPPRHWQARSCPQKSTPPEEKEWGPTAPSDAQHATHSGAEKTAPKKEPQRTTTTRAPWNPGGIRGYWSAFAPSARHRRPQVALRSDHSGEYSRADVENS